MSDAPVTVLERHVSPDQRLVLIAVVAKDGTEAVGFEGSDWHTHPDLLASWLGVPESEAIRSFINLVVGDELPIIMSVDGGNTIQPRVTDDLIADFDFFGRANCIVRYWSGKSYPH